MANKFDQYSEVLTALVQEAISCTPESWKNGTLSISCDGTRIDYKLKNSESEDPASLSEKLRYLCEMYWVAFRDNGEPWLESEVNFQNTDGKWSFNASHKFPEAPKKPKWKFWQ